MDLTKNISNEKEKNMTTIVVGAVALVVGLVVGVLFGRRNTQKVEAALAEAKALLKKAGIDA